MKYRSTKPKPRVHTDEFGNSVIVDEGVIYLRLAGKKRRLKVGTISADRKLIVRRIRAKHLHRVSQSYGFNEYIMSNATKFEWVVLRDDFGTYLIPLVFIVENGTFLYFKEQGFERQLFLSLDILEQFKTE